VTNVNDAPIANDDAFTTNEDTPATGNVLTNDTDVDAGTTLTAIQVTGPAHGTLTLNANGGFTYTPAADYNGTDSFTYKANDGELDSSLTTVSITVVAVNDAPVATNQSVATAEDTPAAITLSGTDVENSPLTFTVVSGPAHGT